MSYQDKYFVGKVADAQACLTPTEGQELMRLLQKIHAHRTAGGKKKTRYLVLNLSDPFARRAIEAYVDQAERAPEFGGNAYIRTVVDKFRDMLIATRQLDAERLPD